MSFPYLKDQQPSALIQTHVVALIENFDRYFPTERYAILNDKSRMQNPFEFECPDGPTLLKLTPSPAEETESCKKKGRTPRGVQDSFCRTPSPAEETELLQLSCERTDPMDL